MPDLNELRKQLFIYEQELTSLRARLKRVNFRLSELQRKGAKAGDVKNKLAELNHAINDKKSAIRSLKSDLKRSAKDAKHDISSFSEDYPILLFPVRIETRFQLNLTPPQLWVRVYPDKIAIETHEPLLTEDEYQAGRDYYFELWKAEKNPGNDEPEEIRKAAWRTLAKGYGPQRAAWIARMFDGSAYSIDQPQHADCKIPYITNWPSKAGDNEPKFKDIDADEIPLRPDSWSQPPKSFVMPDRFKVRIRSSKGGIIEKTGNPIPHPLIVGPNPYPLSEYGLLLFTVNLGADPDLTVENILKLVKQEIESRGSSLSPAAEIVEKERGAQWEVRDGRKKIILVRDGNSLHVHSKQTLFEDESIWITDFEKAVEAGMGFKIDLSKIDFLPDDALNILVLGIKASADVAAGAEGLSNLITSHHYTVGFSFVPQGTPTNNTADERSGFSSRDEGYEASYQTERGDSIIGADLPGKKDGSRMALALGISRNVFDHIAGAGGTENEGAGDVQAALWPATWGYFLETMMKGCFDKETIEHVKTHFNRYVRARGPLSAVRAGTMPYGVLPTSNYLEWEYEKGSLDSGHPILHKLNGILKKFYSMWKKMAEDHKRVPRVGASDDPDQELVRILGMDGCSLSCRVRPVTTDSYLDCLLYYLKREITGGSFPFGLDEKLFSGEGAASAAQGLGYMPGEVSGQNSLKNWWERFLAEREKCQRHLRDVCCDGKKDFPVLHAFPWGGGFDLDEYLNDQKSDETRLQWLLRNLKYESNGGNPEIAPDLLEQMVMETLDLSTHRLDAWITSLITHRLGRIREKKPEGVYISAFGWLEDLRPSDGGDESGGYIHGPSISHAAAAAILRNAYLTHANKKNSELMAVDLSSERVRRALWLLDGIREGQTLSALLGYQFEKGLHENYRGTALELDQFIYAFRNLYPLTAGKETKSEEDESAEAVAARNVVDGLRLVEAWEKKEIPFGKKGLPRANKSVEYQAIVQELNSLDETLDAVGDLGLAESVYQSVNGNYDRAGALLESLAANGRPPEPEVVLTPRGGINLKHRVSVLFTGNPSDPGNWPLTPRGNAEPYLNGWAAMLLGDPGNIKCRILYASSAQEDPEVIDEEEVISLGDINAADDQKIGPLDFLYTCIMQPTGEVTELEQRLAYYIRNKEGLGKNNKVKIEFIYNEEWSYRWDAEYDKSFFDIFEFSRSISDVISNARFLKPEELILPKEGEDKQGNGFSDDMIIILSDRFLNAKNNFEEIAGNLSIQVDNEMERSYPGIRALLLSISRYAIQGAIPAVAGDLELNQLFSFNLEQQSSLDNQVLSPDLRTIFEYNGFGLSSEVSVLVKAAGRTWFIVDTGNTTSYGIEKAQDGTSLQVYDGDSYLMCSAMLAQAESAREQAAGMIQKYNDLLGLMFSAEATPEILDQLDHGSFPNELQSRLDTSAGIIAVSIDEHSKKWTVRKDADIIFNIIRRTNTTGEDTVYFFKNTNNAENSIQLHIQGLKTLFGENLTVLPPFKPTNKDELGLALKAENTAVLLDGESTFWPELWLQQAAQTHPKLRQFEIMMMLALAISGEELSLRIGQLPFKEKDRWMALPFKKNDNEEKPQGILSMVTHVPFNFNPDSMFCGLVLDDWDELIPNDTETTAIAYEFNRPNSEPPQALLLAVPSRLGKGDGKWNWDDLAGSVAETLEMAKVRAVDIDALKEIGCFLPALYLQAASDKTVAGPT